MTGRLIYRTACHSGQFSGRIAKRDYGVECQSRCCAKLNEMNWRNYYRKEGHVKDHKVQCHWDCNGQYQPHVIPQWERQQRFVFWETVDGVEHLNGHKNGKWHRRGFAWHPVRKHLTSDGREIPGARVEVRLEVVWANLMGTRSIWESYQLRPRNLRSCTIVHEPPSVAKDGCGSDISSYYHVSHKEPLANDGLWCFPWSLVHDVVIGRIESKCSSRQAISY